MKKLLLLLLISCMIANASSFIKNGELKLVDDKAFVIRCIQGWKWIQFVDLIHGKGGTYYVPSGNPQQMFERHRFYNGAINMLPVECDK